MKKTPAPAVPSPLDPLALSARAREYCRKAHIRTPRDLAARKGTDWTRTPGAKAVAGELDRAIRKIATSRLLERGEPVRFLDDEGAVVRDFPLSKALLSIRARRALETLGISSIAQLAEWDAAAINGEKLRNVGRVTVAELSRLVRERRVKAPASDGADEARAAVLALFTPAKPSVPKAECEALLRERGFAKGQVAEVLRPLVSKGVLALERGSIKRNFPTIDQFLSSLDRSPRNIKIVKGHLNGKTLDAVGRPLGLTRERVRQIYRLLFADVIRNAAGRLAEDRFDAVFRGYEFTQAEFCAVFGEPVSTFRYLDATRPAGKANPREAAADAALDPAVRAAVRAYYAKKKPGRPARAAETPAPAPAKPVAAKVTRKPVKKATKRG